MPEAPGFGTEVRAAFDNLLFKSAAQFLDKGCRILLVVLAAPLIGQSAFGELQFATTLTTLLALAADLGLCVWTTRALARGQAGAAAVIVTALRIRALAAIPYALVMVLLAFVLQPRAALLLLGVAALSGMFIDHFGAILRGTERFSDEARLSGARAFLVTTAGLGAVSLDRSLLALAAGMAAGTLAGGAYGLWLVNRRQRLETRAFDPALARAAVRQSLPIWLAGLLSLLYFKGDAILLHALAGDAELGAYGAAYKIMEGSMILPAVVMAATFPALARAHGDRGRQRRWELLIAAVLLGAGLAVGAAAYFGRGWIIVTLFGPGFTRAFPSLRVLSLAIPPIYLNFGLTHFLIARDLAHRNLVFAASLLVLNVAINLAVIPSLGGLGAAWATLATEVALTGCCLGALRTAPGAARTARTRL